MIVSFEDILGNRAIREQLVSSIDNNITPPALLFFGREGSANFTIGVNYVKYLGCENTSEKSGCLTCSFCKKFLKGIHPDVHFTFPMSITDESRNYFHIKWRSFFMAESHPTYYKWAKHINISNKKLIIHREETHKIHNFLFLKPFESKYKFVFIWLPEHMNVATTNSLLKVIEEPTEQTMFICISNDIARINPTFLSRFQTITVPPYPKEDIVFYMQENFNLSKEDSNSIALIAEGSLLKAIDSAQKQSISEHVELI